MEAAGRPDRGLHGGHRPRRRAWRRSQRYPVVLKADGLAAGKGVIIAGRRGGGAGGAATTCWWSTASAPSRWSSRSSWRARSCRCWRCATASGRSRWPPPRTTSGSSTATRAPTPAAWAPTRRCPPSTRPAPRRSAPPCTSRCSTSCARRGIAFHGVLYAGLMMTARRGPEGAGVQRPLRRPRDAGDPAAPADRPAGAAARGHRAGRPGATHPRWQWSPQTAVTVVLASAGYPESSSSGDVISGLDAVPREVLVTHAGTARDTGRGDRHRRGTGAERDRARRRRRCRPRSCLCCSGHDRVRRRQMRRDIALRAVR